MLRFALVAMLSVTILACHLPPEEGSFYQEGAFLSVAPSYSVNDFDVEDVPHVDIEESVGAAGRFGYKFRGHVAVELDAKYFEGFDAVALGVEVGEFDGWSVGGNVKGYLPFDAQNFPYALVGLGHIDGELDLDGGPDLDEEDLYVKLGLGHEVYLSHEVALFFEASYTRPLDDLEDFPFWTATAGVQFALGGAPPAGE